MGIDSLFGAVMSEVDTLWLQQRLETAKAGDSDSWNLILEWCMKRMQSLAHRMLREFPGVRRWEDTNDIVQSSMLRLVRALKVLPINSTREFFSLAATQIRRELLDLARHYSGPQGLGANYESGFHGFGTDLINRGLDPADEKHGSYDLNAWRRLHEAVECLEPEEREVFSLVFYHGWTQAKIAELFEVDERTIRRRWRRVCEHLRELLAGNWPDGFEPC